MPDIGFKTIPKQCFFDAKKVMDAVSKGRRVALSKIGAFVRTRARSSMRRTKKSAAPGQPPAAHAGQLKDLIYFAYDDNSQSVVVGPVKFKDGTAPALLEFGGTVSADKDRYVRGAAGRDQSGRFTQGQSTKIAAGTQLHYRGNPFMGPSLEAEIAAGTISSAWGGVVKS